MCKFSISFLIIQQEEGSCYCVSAMLKYCEDIKALSLWRNAPGCIQKPSYQDFCNIVM